MVRDLNYFPLDVESNIYGMTKLEFDDKSNKILVATLDCRIYCINYNRFKPQTKEVEFTYIPNGAKIISIGALKRGPNDFVIGITHSLSPATSKSTTNRELVTGDGYNSRQTTYYFNIYASESVLPNFDLDYVAQGCQTIRLRYVPYHLYSTELLLFNQAKSIDSEDRIERKPIWLLSGGDNHLHAYLEDKPYQSFNEVSMDEWFPELCDKQKSIALWIDVANIVRCLSVPSETMVERVIALGFEDGSVRLYYSKLSKLTNRFELIRASSFDSYTTIIPCVRLFKIKSTNHNSILRKRLRNKGAVCDIDSVQEQSEKLNLLIASSTNASLIFRDVLHNGLTDSQELPQSQRLDCVTSAAIDDTNIDGCNELLLSTHGKELITYQYNCSKDEYVLDEISVLNYPIFTMIVLDLTGDGMKDLIVLLASGILIMQTSAVDLMEICKRRVKAVLSALR